MQRGPATGDGRRPPLSWRAVLAGIDLARDAVVVAVQLRRIAGLVPVQRCHARVPRLRAVLVAGARRRGRGRLGRRGGGGSRRRGLGCRGGCRRRGLRKQEVRGAGGQQVCEREGVRGGRRGDDEGSAPGRGGDESTNLHACLFLSGRRTDRGIRAVDRLSVRRLAAQHPPPGFRS
ncbi:hypothetical protein RHRU231_950106 [Rhodococcus ruber]|uniref:Uncharacterized protein n=1 Tax=Rhodococcus ruber TaxID=1830 RepID=A0A098BXK8_9NOCA|nr:hypothetical protein RHRU231_950106 [Rhodococcus ruber]